MQDQTASLVLALIKTSVQPLSEGKTSSEKKTKQKTPRSQGIRCAHGVKEAAATTELRKVAKAARSGRWGGGEEGDRRGGEERREMEGVGKRGEGEEEGKQQKLGPRAAALSLGPHTAPTCRAGDRPVRRIRLLG